MNARLRAHAGIKLQMRMLRASVRQEDGRGRDPAHRLAGPSDTPEAVAAFVDRGVLVAAALVRYG